MKHIKPTKMLPAAMLALGLMGCGGASKSNTEELPSFDDLVGYLEDGTFTERYIPKPHEIAKFANIGNTHFTHQTPNAAAEFERYLGLHPDADLSGYSLYTNNTGGVPYNERSPVCHPDTYRGSYFRYTCPVSTAPCQYDPARVERISPEEWEIMERKYEGGSKQEILIPISDYADANNPDAVLIVHRTADGKLFRMTLSKNRDLRFYDISARFVENTGVVLRYVKYGFKNGSLRE